MAYLKKGTTIIIPVIEPDGLQHVRYNVKTRRFRFNGSQFAYTENELGRLVSTTPESKWMEEGAHLGRVYLRHEAEIKQAIVSA